MFSVQGGGVSPYLFLAACICKDPVSKMCYSVGKIGLLELIGHLFPSRHLFLAGTLKEYCSQLKGLGNEMASSPSLSVAVSLSLSLSLSLANRTG